jgi:hypothetical protein
MKKQESVASSSLQQFQSMGYSGLFHFQQRFSQIRSYYADSTIKVALQEAVQAMNAHVFILWSILKLDHWSGIQRPSSADGAFAISKLNQIGIAEMFCIMQ